MPRKRIHMYTLTYPRKGKHEFIKTSVMVLKHDICLSPKKVALYVKRFDIKVDFHIKHKITINVLIVKSKEST
jgi:hypothetical protein